MKVIYNSVTRPSFNLALEEYLLKQTNDDYFMLWRNAPSVIVGRNQNTFAEINREFVTKNNIAVIRRLTGGGAVFHDLGNLNYTFITRQNSHFNDYSYFAKPVIETLKKLGVNAELSGRNDMLIDGKKFSGNAQCSHKGAVMHHGTIMFCADVSYLNGALNVNPLKIKSKGIASVKSRVTNICEYLHDGITIEQFTEILFNTVISNSKDAYRYELKNDEIEKVLLLEKEKYATNAWNYGFKHDYSVSNEKKLDCGLINVCVNIKENKIESIRIFGDYFGKKDVSELENILCGTDYNVESIYAVLKTVDIGDYIVGISIDELCNLII